MEHAVAGEVRFASVDERDATSVRLERTGHIVAELEGIGPSARGRLGEVIDEAIEEALAARGAAAPGITSGSDRDATLSDQLFRARRVGGRGPRDRARTASRRREPARRARAGGLRDAALPREATPRATARADPRRARRHHGLLRRSGPAAIAGRADDPDADRRPRPRSRPRPATTIPTTTPALTPTPAPPCSGPRPRPRARPSSPPARPLVLSAPPLPRLPRRSPHRRRRRRRQGRTLARLDPPAHRRAGAPAARRPREALRRELHATRERHRRRVSTTRARDTPATSSRRPSPRATPTPPRPSRRPPSGPAWSSTRTTPPRASRACTAPAPRACSSWTRCDGTSRA